MATLHAVYELMCNETIIHKKYIRPYSMPEKEFYPRILSADLKEAFPSFLNHEHPSFQPHVFTTLVQKDIRSWKQRELIIAYYMKKPSAIDTLLQTSQIYLSKETSTICWDRYISLTQRWLRLLPLKKDAPVRTYLLHTYNNYLQYHILMTWMILDAFSTSPEDLASLYKKYSDWSNNFSSSTCVSLLKISTHLQQLYSNARKALNNRLEDRQSQYKELSKEFSRLEAFYRQNLHLFQEKNYQPLLEESFHHFRLFLLDFQKKSFFTACHLDLMQTSLKQLEQRLSKYP